MAKHFGTEGGSAINIGSTASTITPPTRAVYTATKGAVDAVTHVLAKGLGPRNIRANSIKPGMVGTEGTHTAGFIGRDLQKGFEAQTPLGRLRSPRTLRRSLCFYRQCGYELQVLPKLQPAGQATFSSRPAPPRRMIISACPGECDIA